MTMLSRYTNPCLFQTGARCFSVLLFLVLLSLLSGGCIKTLIYGDSTAPGVSTPPPPVKAHPLDEARSAFSQGDYARAEAISLRLAKDKTLDAANRAEAGKILAAAALRNNHPNVALDGLEHWRLSAKGADTEKEWQDTWCKILRGLSSHDARTKANALYQDASRPLLVRSVAGVSMAVRQWTDGELGQTMAALENIYASARNTGEQATIEGRLALELSKAGAGASSLAASAVNDDNREKFPYSVIFLDQLHRQSRKADTRESARAALDEFRTGARLANPALFDGPPQESDIVISPASGVAALAEPIQGKPVVLALPISGQYAGISSKIVNGARAACETMSASGRKVSLVVIDTDQSDWISRVDALPAEATVIGGPLRRNDYSAAKSSGLTSRRAVLAFLPGLDTGDEGRVAWRFFSSPQDQVDALLQFSSRLGISSYGVFYPDENFGQRMAALFEERARASGASGVVRASYDPKNQTGWMTSAKNLLTSGKGAAPFKAIFLPDSWKNMDVIVPNFFYYNETRQVLMGTSLWEQGLSGNTFVSAQYYGLAVFPGTWNATQPTPAGKKLEAWLSASGKSSADFWTGLGYDFARLSASLGVSEGWTPDSVNAALASAASLDWSMAPISWNNGLASQRMYLFTPKENGFVPVDEGDFKAAFTTAWSR